MSNEFGIFPIEEAYRTSTVFTEVIPKIILDQKIKQAGWG